MVERHSNEVVDIHSVAEPVAEKRTQAPADGRKAQSRPSRKPVARAPAKSDPAKKSRKKPSGRKPSSSPSGSRADTSPAHQDAAASGAGRSRRKKSPATPKASNAPSKPTPRKPRSSPSAGGSASAPGAAPETAGPPAPPVQPTLPSPAPVAAGSPTRRRACRPSLSIYRAALLHGHRLTSDRSAAHLERVSTAPAVPVEDLQTAGADQPERHGYRATPRRLIRWVLDGLPDAIDQSTFVDIGSGRGRVLFEAARYPFQRIVGIECAEPLHEDAALNLRHWPRALMRCRDVDLILDDALDTPLPDGDIVVWMFDPFPERMTTRMAARLAGHANHWNVTVVLVQPGTMMAFRQSAAFRPVELAGPIRRRIGLLSPYAVAIFAAGPSKR